MTTSSGDSVTQRPTRDTSISADSGHQHFCCASPVCCKQRAFESVPQLLALAWTFQAKVQAYSLTCTASPLQCWMHPPVRTTNMEVGKERGREIVLFLFVVFCRQT
jgi:hypothetical protein